MVRGIDLTGCEITSLVDGMSEIYRVREIIRRYRYWDNRDSGTEIKNKGKSFSLQKKNNN